MYGYKTLRVTYFCIAFELLTLYAFRLHTGDEGIGYLAAVAVIDLILWLIFGRGLAGVGGRMMKSRRKKGQEDNVRALWRILRGSAVVQSILGAGLLGVLSTVLLRGAFHMPRAAILGWVLAPAFFLRGMSEMLRGYCEGHESNKAGMISDVLRALTFPVFGELLLTAMQGYGQKVASLLKVDDFVSIYACFGVCIGWSVSEIFAFLFLLVHAIITAGRGVRVADPVRSRENRMALFYGLWRKRGDSILTGLLVVFPFLAVLLLLTKPGTEAEDGLALAHAYGRFLSTGFLIPLVLAVLSLWILAALQERCIVAIRKEEYRYLKTLYQEGFHLSVVCGSFAFGYLAAVCRSLGELLVPGNGKAAENAILLGGLAALLVVVNFWMMKTLIYCGHLLEHIAILVLGDGAFLLSFLLLRGKYESIGGALPLSFLIWQLVMTIGLLLLLWIRWKLSVDLIRAALLPIVVSSLLALIQMLVARGISPHLGNIFTVLFCLVAQFFLYLVVLLILRNLPEREIRYLPGAVLIERLAQLLHAI